MRHSTASPVFTDASSIARPVYGRRERRHATTFSRRIFRVNDHFRSSSSAHLPPDSVPFLCVSCSSTLITLTSNHEQLDTFANKHQSWRVFKYNHKIIFENQTIWGKFWFKYRKQVLYNTYIHAQCSHQVAVMLCLCGTSDLDPNWQGRLSTNERGLVPCKQKDIHHF